MSLEESVKTFNQISNTFRTCVVSSPLNLFPYLASNALASPIYFYELTIGKTHLIDLNYETVSFEFYQKFKSKKKYTFKDSFELGQHTKKLAMAKLFDF